MPCAKPFGTAGQRMFSPPGWVSPGIYRKPDLNEAAGGRGRMRVG